MSEPSTYIRDHQSLIDLNNTLEYIADSILKILESVDSYLQGVLKAFEDQAKQLEEELEAAENALSAAEQALCACESSQRWDEENGEYVPCCDYEAGRVRLAREIRDKCKDRLYAARSIIQDCKFEFDEYKKWPGVLFPPGGEKTLECLAKGHTDQATSKLREIIETIEEYRRCPVSLDRNVQQVLTPEINDEKQAMENATQEAKRERFDEAIQKAIERQEDKNSEIVDANRVIRCPDCGRPPIACICRNVREEEYTRDDIHIITEY